MNHLDNEGVKFGLKHGRELIIVFLVVAAILGGIGFFVQSTVITVILLILGLVSIGLGISSAADKNRFFKYGTIIYLQNITSTQQLASATGKTTSVVEAELGNLISLGYFGVARLEAGEILLNNEVAAVSKVDSAEAEVGAVVGASTEAVSQSNVPGANTSQPGTLITTTTSGNAAPVPQRMRSCPGCGAPSKDRLCEYCGSITNEA